ncbi:hypothetical protein ABZ897_47665 [Nonomuraea sp. NPDC046802]|uniref:hypothetical protein n=1 Tax=Nonomuraea sp. NPDC046802 TaxID=3154919 RepID=UPI0033CC6B96
MAAGRVDIVEQGPRRRGWVGLVVLAALVAVVPLIVVLTSRDTPRPRPHPTVTPTPVRDTISVTPNAVYPAADGTGGTMTMRVTFPDGTRAEIAYPADLNLASMGARPYTGGTLTTAGRHPGDRPGQAAESGTGRAAVPGAGKPEESRAGEVGVFRSLSAPLYGEAEIAAGRPMIRRLTGDVTLWPGPLGAGARDSVLLFDFGGWRIALRDERSEMTFDERLAWAEHVRGTLTPDGFLTLSAAGPVRLSRPGEVRDGVLVGPQLWLGGLSRRMLVLAPVPDCERPAPVVLDPRHTITGSACRGGFYLAASGDRDFVGSALKDVRVSRQRPGNAGRRPRVEAGNDLRFNQGEGPCPPSPPTP